MIIFDRILEDRDGGHAAPFPTSSNFLLSRPPKILNLITSSPIVLEQEQEQEQEQDCLSPSLSLSQFSIMFSTFNLCSFFVVLF